MDLHDFAQVKTAGIIDWYKRKKREKIERVARTPKYDVLKEGLRSSLHGGLTGAAVTPILYALGAKSPSLRKAAIAALIGGGVGAPLTGALSAAGAIGRNRRIEEAQRYLESVSPKGEKK